MQYIDVLIEIVHTYVIVSRKVLLFKLSLYFDNYWFLFADVFINQHLIELLVHLNSKCHVFYDVSYNIIFSLFCKLQATCRVHEASSSTDKATEIKRW